MSPLQLVITLLNRAKEVCSSEALLNAEISKILTDLKDNDYPRHFVHNILREWKQGKPINQSPKQHFKQTMVIPYVKGLSEKFRKDVKDIGIKVYFRNPKNLGAILKPNKINDPFKISGIIYKVPCCDCNQFYIGESGRTWYERSKEHHRDIKNKNLNNSLYTLMAQTKHQIDWNNVSILDFLKQKHERKTLEGMYIQKYKKLTFNLFKGCNVPSYTNKQVHKALK